MMLPYYRMGSYLFRRSRARLGLNAAKMAMANRKAIYRLGRGAFARAGKYRRSKARTAKSRMSSTPHHGPSNQAFYDENGLPALTTTEIQIDRKTLYLAPVQIAKPPGNTELLGQPARNEIRLKGMKLCMNWQNFSFNNPDIFYFHIAIIQPKAMGATVDGVQFFSNLGGGDVGTERYIDFTDFTTDPSTNFKYNCNGINIQKYNVLTHRKFKVGISGDSSTGRSTGSFDHYFNLSGKRVEWNNVADVNIAKPLYICVWYERMVTNSAVTANNCVHFNLTTSCFWKNI